jgi:hypothetical protein
VFQWNISPPPSGSKSNPSKKTAEAVDSFVNEKIIFKNDISMQVKALWLGVQSAG